MSGRDEVMVALPALTPEQVAAAFWRLDDHEQADFFAALERLAGVKLCFQMSGVFTELVRRSERGDYEGLNGFRTMLEYAERFPEAAAEWRADRAKRELARIGADA